jgi:hypothetical protein
MMDDENRTCDFAIEPIGWTVSRFVLVDRWNPATQTQPNGQQGQ